VPTKTPFYCTASTWRGITSYSPVIARMYLPKADGASKVNRLTIALDATAPPDNLSVFL